MAEGTPMDSPSVPPPASWGCGPPAPGSSFRPVPRPGMATSAKGKRWRQQAVRRSRPWLLALLVCTLAAGGGLWLHDHWGLEETDNAQLQAHLVDISSRVAGSIMAVPVQDNQAEALQAQTGTSRSGAEAAANQAAADQQVAQAEQEHQARLVQMEQQFGVRRQQLEQEGLQRRQQLDQEYIELKRQLGDQHERLRQQSLQELEQVRQESLRIQRDSQAEAERIHADALQFRQQSQQQCEALISRSRQEASAIQEGANRYAEQVLGELEGRLQDMGKVVMAGRRELVKLQSTDPSSLVAPAANESGRAAPLGRAGRAAERLRQAAGQR